MRGGGRGPCPPLIWDSVPIHKYFINIKFPKLKSLFNHQITCSFISMLVNASYSTGRNPILIPSSTYSAEACGYPICVSAGFAQKWSAILDSHIQQLYLDKLHYSCVISLPDVCVVTHFAHAPVHSTFTGANSLHWSVLWCRQKNILILLSAYLNILYIGCII